MQDEINQNLKIITKRIEKLASESQIKQGFNQHTSRLRLLAELVREQAEINEIFISKPKEKNTSY